MLFCFNLSMWYTQGVGILGIWYYLCTMFITKAKKYRQQDDGTILAYSYYRLTKSFRDSSGRIRKRNVLCLGELDGYSKGEREELADMLTEMIENGQHVITDNPKLRQAALDFYLKYRESDYARENDPVLREEALRREREQRKDLITVHIDSLTQREARTIGPEALCHSTLKMLQIGKFLYAKGWSRDQVTLAMMQIIARSIYPYSELKTVRYLKENTALAELFKFSKVKITKDALYRSALRLWDVHRELEDWLHQRVCNMFQLEEKILLFDITNAYFEGRMENSDLCRFGRSKEKRNDCKIVVLAAVVNTEGLLVRTAIYEGNRQDRTTLEEVIGSISKETSPDAKKIVVMDAGFYTKDNIEWLTDHHFDYITVLPSGDAKFSAASNKVVHHQDCKKQEIRLQMGSVTIDGTDRKALLVDSDAKTTKERSMYDRACQCYEEGLEAVRAGILKKGGTKKRDAVNKRIGKLDEKYGAIRKSFAIDLTYEGEGKDEKVVSISWKKNGGLVDTAKKFHGKYVLITSLDEKEEINVWRFYNVIRTVEETFHTLKSDLDIRPVYHKSDEGIKAHLNLAVLAYWLVSVTKYRLKVKKYDNVRWDEIIRIASTQVIVTAELKAEDGETIRVRQCTEAEEKLSNIYRMLGINPHPLGKIKSVVHPKPPSKNANTENQSVT